MSRNKVYLGLLISVILAVIIYVSYGMTNIGKENPSYTVSVIVNDSSNARWNAFKEGLNQGTEGSQIYLNVVSTAEFSSIEEECQIISREIENGADGIIVAPYSNEDQDDLFIQTVSANPVVLVENGIAMEDYYSTVKPDHYGLGAAVAQAVIEGEEGDLDGIKIGVLGGNQKTISMQNRLEGFLDAMAETDAQIVWKVMGDSSGSAYNLRQYAQNSPADIIVALDNNETERAVDFLLENRDIACRLYGAGRSEKTVYYLDKGMIQTLIVPNEYYMGYQSMVLMAQKLETYAADTKNIEVDFLSVTKETMFNKDIERILFPTVL